MLPATGQNSTTAFRPMFEKETESVFRKQLKELWNVQGEHRTDKREQASVLYLSDYLGCFLKSLRTIMDRNYIRLVLLCIGKSPNLIRLSYLRYPALIQTQNITK